MPRNIAELRKQLAQVKPWVYVAVALGLVLFGYYAIQGARFYNAYGIPYVGPDGKTKTLQAKIKAIQSELGAKEPKAAEAQKKLDAQEEQLAELGQLFDYPVIDDLVAIVSATAQESNLDLLSVTTGDPQVKTLGETVYAIRPMSVTLQGDTSNFSVFLSLMHDQVPVTQAMELRIAGVARSPTTRIDLAFYLLPQPIVAAQAKPGAEQKEAK